MLRRRFNTTVSLALIVVLTLTFLTGFVAAALDLNRFAYHKYAAYAAIALALVHVVLHWRTLVGQVRRWLLAGASPPAARPAGPRGAPAPGRAAPLPTGRSDARPQLGPLLRRRSLLRPAVLFAAGAGLGHWWGSRGAALAEGEDVGQVYHRWSVPTYAGLLTKSFHVRPQPPPYKEYPVAPAIPLPPPPPLGPSRLDETLLRRRSVREYGERPLGLAEVSALLHYSAGITDRRDPTLAFRAVPSSGALYPVELYPIVFRVADVAPGVYHYDVQRHRLELLQAGDFRLEVFQAAVSQEMVLRSALVLALTGLFSRVHWKYVDRSYRYLMLEAGHLGQNVYLVATALGLGPCGIGAFFDDDLNRLLGVDGHDEATVYLLAIGPRP